LVAENALPRDGIGFDIGDGFVPGEVGLVSGTAAFVAGGVGFVVGAVGFVVGTVGSVAGATVFESGVTGLDTGAVVFESCVTALESDAAGVVAVFPDSVCVAFMPVFWEFGSLDCCWFGVPSVPTVRVKPSRVFCSVFCKFSAMLAIGWLAVFAAWLDESALGALAVGALLLVSAVAIAPPPLPTKRPADSTQTPAATRNCVVEMISSVLKRPHRKVIVGHCCIVGWTATTILLQNLCGPD
jgi:hypothetical protein